MKRFNQAGQPGAQSGFRGLYRAMFGKQEQPDRELLLRVKTILFLRIFFLIGIVVTVFILQQKYPYRTPIVPLSVTLALAFLFSAIYSVLLRWEWNLSLIASIQVIGDLVFVGGIIYSTGGIESPLSFLYSLVVVATSVMLPRTAIYLVASAASISFGLIIDLEYFGILHPVYLFPKSTVPHEGGYVFYIVFVNIASFYSVAFLSSLLSHRLRLIKEELALTNISLEKLQAFHRNVVQNMGNGLVTTDLNGIITSMNPASERITGVNQTDIVGHSIYSLLPMSPLKTLFDEIPFTALPDYIEGTYTRKDGTHAFIRIRMSRLEGNPQSRQPQGFIFVFEDLTEIKRMEEKMSKAERLATVGRFSAGMAHEIRNPLASLSGSIEVLNTGLNLSGDDKRLMDIVIKETGRLNRIVSDFLHFANPRDNRNSIVDISQLIKDAILLMKNSSEYHSSISIDFQDHAQHLVLNCDEQQIQQLVWNLCINGIQSMSSGGTLVIEIEAIDGYKFEGYYSDHKGILLKVKDTGCGIPEEKRKHIFDPFYTTKEEGVGLGLARVFQIVERHDGYISLISEPGVGTQFIVYLPQKEALAKSPDQIKVNP